MNGYALASAFRTLRESWRFTSIEADLYYELVGIANERGWPAGFQYSNQLICATIGISEKSLIAARNRLKQAGLLDFVSGQKRAPTSYTLRQKGLPQVSKKGGKSASVSDSESDSPLYKELKQKENELQIKLQEERKAADAARFESEKKMTALLAENELLKAKPIEVSTPLVAAPPPLKASRGGKQLMADTPFADYATFAAAWEAAAAANPATYADFAGVNLPHYHAALLDWSSANGEKKADWLATIRGSVRRDADEGRLRKAGVITQQSNPQQHAVNRPSYSNAGNAAAARLQTPTPDASSANAWGLPAYTPPASAATLPGGN